MQLEHTLVPENIGDRRTRFVVSSGVGQLVVRAERFAVMAGADPASDVKLLAHHIFPKAVDGINVGLLAGQRRHIGHATVHIDRAHGMANRFSLLDYGQMILHIALIIEVNKRLTPIIVTALIQEELGQLQIAFRPRHPIKLDQPQLDLLVARHIAQLVRAKGAFDQIGIFDRNIEQATFAGGAIVGDRRFVHMPHIVEFMVDAQVGPAGQPFVVGAQFFGGAIALSNRACSVEITISLLRRANPFDQLIQIGVQCWIRVQMQGKGRAFNDLEDIRVIKKDPFMVTSHTAGGLIKVSEPAGFVTFLEVVTNRHRAIGFNARRPEGIGNGYARKRYRLVGIMRGRGSRSCHRILHCSGV